MHGCRDQPRLEADDPVGTETRPGLAPARSWEILVSAQMSSELLSPESAELRTCIQNPHHQVLFGSEDTHLPSESSEDTLQLGYLLGHGISLKTKTDTVPVPLPIPVLPLVLPVPTKDHFLVLPPISKLLLALLPYLVLWTVGVLPNRYLLDSRQGSFLLWIEPVSLWFTSYAVMEPSRWDLWFPVSSPTWLASTQVCCDSERSEISEGLGRGRWEEVQAKGECGSTGSAVREHGNRKGIPG